jgi:hypothetical protein
MARSNRLDPDGRLLYPELLYSCPKKSGKTAFAAMVVLYVVLVLGGKFAEGYAVANDLEQAQGRVFQALRRIVEASPLLRDEAVITASRIEFPTTGASIQAIAGDYAGAAGANPSITAFDELWGFTSERSRRLWDEMAPVPTRRISCRLTTTYAGFDGESLLLAELYKQGLKGELVGSDLRAQPGLLTFWSMSFIAPWQTAAWREQMRSSLRTSAYLRLIENRWVTSETPFIELEWWDTRCVDAGAAPVVIDPMLPIWLVELSASLPSRKERSDGP